MDQERIVWTAKEYEHREHGPDWFWAVGVIALAVVVISVIFGNLLFAIFAIIGTLTLMLYAVRHPQDIRVEINRRGLMLDTTLYPYAALHSFWIIEHTLPQKLIIKSAKRVMPHHVIRIEGVAGSDVHEFLLQYLDEEELPEPLAEKVIDALGL